MKIHHPKDGSFRQRQGFLFFPKTIDNETRWLEKATWQQTYSSQFGIWFDWNWLENTEFTD